ncbi:MAG: hypothetical protein H0T18_07900 [Chloroflexia bacterium]|nr:hypothetical protein [Chloroflexia bacterium]
MSDRAKTDATAPAADAFTTPGKWVIPGVSYVNPERRHCALCGRPIARRYWQETIAGTTRVFCDPAHALLKITYPLSTTGDAE